MLSIVLIPSAALLLVGATLAGYLIYQSVMNSDFAARARESVGPVTNFVTSVQEERRLTLQQLDQPEGERRLLEDARAEVDGSLGTIAEAARGLVDEAPPGVREAVGRLDELIAKLPATRQEADGGQLGAQAAFDVYNELLDVCGFALQGLARGAPDGEIAAEQLVALQLFFGADGMARGNALAAVAVAGDGFSPADFRGYVGQVGGYHGTLARAEPSMTPPVRELYQQLLAGDSWAKVTAMENALIERGPIDETASARTRALDEPELPVDPAAWQSAARQVADQLLHLYTQHTAAATDLGTDAAESSLIMTIIGASAVLLIAVVAFLVALRLSNGLVGRLERLREETLDLADERLPRIVGRLRAGRVVDLDEEVAPLDHGTDEIGQVAEAFNTAQHTAVSAAVQEAKTREGTKTVFLNIAHRSQVIVHEQLKLLDTAERNEEDPDQLGLLFQLDHLATRARRHAENLIILGGEQPGRQWRNPVKVMELTRSAIAETEEYTRVGIIGLPDVALDGAVVADLVHLLAELVDNATTFSPPESRVQVGGNVVGRGLVIEIEDQGLGIESDLLGDLNATLREPPDFSVMALPEEPCLGLFVVARLAARHGISVSLRDSVYGGVRAIVLVPTGLIATEPGLPEADGPVPPVDVPAPRRHLPRLHRAPVENAPPAEALEAPPAEDLEATEVTAPRDPAGAPEPAAVSDHPEDPEPAAFAVPAGLLAPAEDTPYAGGPDWDAGPDVASRILAALDPGGDETADEVTTQFDAVPAEEPDWPSATATTGTLFPEHEAPQPDGAAARGGFPVEDVDEHVHAPARATASRPAGRDRGDPDDVDASAMLAAESSAMSATDLPPLPKRRRQRNLVPQLDAGPPPEQEYAQQWVSPEGARDRLAAFQQGTRKARQEHDSQ